jgi:hypothetical protein
MASPDPDRSLELALAVVGYQWAMRHGEFAVADPIAGLERLEAEVDAFPDGRRPLSELYPHVARLAALSLRVLADLGDPDEVDGLTGFEGFGLWRESR